MKKITLILSLLVAMVTTAMAEDPAVMTINVNSYYFVSFNNGFGYVYYTNGTYDHLYYEQNDNAVNTHDAKYHFKFTDAGTAADGRQLYYISPEAAPEYFAYNTCESNEGGNSSSVALTNDAAVKEAKGKWYVFNNGSSQFIVPAWQESDGTYTRGGCCWNGWSDPAENYELGLWGKGTSNPNYAGDNELTIQEYVLLAENEYTYTINADNGSLNKGRTGWSTKWTSEDGNLTLTVPAGNMNGSNDDPVIKLFVGQSGNSVYTITAPEGYYVSSYSFDYEKVDDNVADHQYYITQNGVKYYPSAEAITLRVKNLFGRTAAFRMDGVNKGIYVNNFTVTIRKNGALPELTADVNNPKYYTIRSVRHQKYAKYYDNANWMRQDIQITDPSLFYFTGVKESDGVLKVKIHNKATENKMANFAEWNAEGIDWYIRKVETGYGNYPGLAISKGADLTSSTRDSWNSYDSEDQIGDYWSNDVGSTFILTPFEEQKETLPQLSTANCKVYYHIKGLKNNKYATYDGEGNPIKLESDKNERSYWYFVENTEVEAPEGYIACYIYNAANANPVSDPSNGTYVSGTTYYIKQHSNKYIGFVLYPIGHEDTAWNDAGGHGTSVGVYNYDDNGSIWSFEPVGHTENSLWGAISAAKNECLTSARNINSDADFYVYNEDDINEAVSAIEAINGNLIEALNSDVDPEIYLAELRAKTVGRPIEVGKYIMLKNKEYNSYLQINGDKLNGNATINAQTNDFAAIWVVEAGSGEGQVKLKNLKNGKYIGQIRQSEDVGMVDSENAKEFTIEQVGGCYIAFHETTGQNYAYGHINGSNVLVGWEKGENPSQWIAIESDIPTVGSSFRMESALQAFETNQGVTKAVYANGDAPGWKTMDAADKKFYWTIEEIRTDGILNGFSIKNLESNKYLVGNVAQSGAWTLAETPETMQIQVHTNYNAGKINEINIFDGHFDMHANDHGNGGGAGSNIVSWNGDKNSASAWYLVPVADVDAAILDALKDAALAIADNKGKVGYPVDSYFDTFTQAINDATTNDELNAAKTALYAATEVNMPVDGKAYYIKAKFNDGSHTYVFYNETDNAVRNEANKTDLSATFIFRDLKNDGKYAIAHNNGKYLVYYADGKAGAGGANNGFADSYELGDKDAEYKFVRASTRTNNINGFNGDVNAQFFGGFLMQAHNSSDNNLFYLMAGKTSKNFHNAGNNDVYHQSALSSVFYLEEAEYANNVNLTAFTEDDELITINGSSIATFSAPFATVVPENVKAYIATNEENGVILIEQLEEGKAIPANQGVILVGQEAKTVTMVPVAGEEIASVAGNVLGHSAGAEKSLTEGEGYILARGNDGIGFYTTAAGTLAMNKAYLNLAGSASLSVEIRVAGTTAVEDVEVENEEVKAVYDLQGRKVENPTKGIYIINGNKVLVK